MSISSKIKMRPIGVLLDLIQESQQCFETINLFNNLISEKVAPTCFYYFPGKIPLFTRFSTMHVKYAHQYKGELIATSLHTANILFNNKLYKKPKRLMMWDIEWLYTNSDCKQIENILDNFQIAVRSKFHADVLSKLKCNNVTIIDDFNFEGCKRWLDLID